MPGSRSFGWLVSVVLHGLAILAVSAVVWVRSVDDPLDHQPDVECRFGAPHGTIDRLERVRDTCRWQPIVDVPEAVPEEFPWVRAKSIGNVVTRFVEDGAVLECPEDEDAPPVVVVVRGHRDPPTPRRNELAEWTQRAREPRTGSTLGKPLQAAATRAVAGAAIAGMRTRP